MLKKAEEGRELVRYDLMERKAGDDFSEQHKIYQARENELEKEIARLKNQAILYGVETEVAKSDLLELKKKIKEEKALTKEFLGGVRKQIAQEKDMEVKKALKESLKKVEKDASLVQEKFNTDLDLVTQYLRELKASREDIIRDNKMKQAALDQHVGSSPFLFDRPKDIGIVEGNKFARIENGKVRVDISKLTPDTLAEGLREGKSFMLKNLENEPKLLADIAATGHKRGEYYPIELRERIARRLGYTFDEFDRLSPLTKQGKAFRSIEEAWDSGDLMAVMKIMDAGMERLVILSKLASEGMPVSPAELSSIKIQPDYAKLSKASNVEALAMFKEEFEKFFYELFPKVWKGIEETPSLPGVIRNAQDKMAHMGRIEDILMKFGRRGYPRSIEGYEQIAREFALINKLGGKQGLTEFKQVLYAAGADEGSFWDKLWHSMMFVRAASMLSGARTSLKIFSSGTMESTLKVFVEYPIELGLRVLTKQNTGGEALRQYIKLHQIGHWNALKNVARVLGKHGADLLSFRKIHKRGYRFTQTYVDPEASSVDIGGQRRNQPLRYKPNDDKSIMGVFSDVVQAGYELSFFAIDTVDDIFKTMNIQYRLPMLAARQADISVKAML